MMRDFEAFYNEEILPDLLEIEKKRLTQRRIWSIFLISLAAFSILVSVVSQSPFGIFIFVFGMIIYGLINSSGNGSQLAKEYKEKIIRRAVKHYFPEVAFSPEFGLSEEEFRDINIFQRSPNRYRSEDLFSGISEKTRYAFSEVHAEYKSTSQNSKGQTQTNWHDIFRGIIFAADFNKLFETTVVVRRDAWKLLDFGPRIKLEDPRFEERFDCYSNDDQQTRYVLTPSLMERIIEVDNKFGPICLCFRNSKIYITIPLDEDYFDLTIWQSALNPMLIHHELEMIASIRSIVDKLDLNTRIWSKP